MIILVVIYNSRGERYDYISCYLYSMTKEASAMIILVVIYD